MNDAASQPKADEPDPAEPSGSPSLRERANARSAASVSLACLIAALVGVPAIGGLAYGVGGALVSPGDLLASVGVAVVLIAGVAAAGALGLACATAGILFAVRHLQRGDRPALAWPLLLGHATVAIAVLSAVGWLVYALRADS